MFTNSTENSLTELRKWGVTNSWVERIVDHKSKVKTEPCNTYIKVKEEFYQHTSLIEIRIIIIRCNSYKSQQTFVYFGTNVHTNGRQTTN